MPRSRNLYLPKKLIYLLSILTLVVLIFFSMPFQRELTFLQAKPIGLVGPDISLYADKLIISLDGESYTIGDQPKIDSDWDLASKHALLEVTWQVKAGERRLSIDATRTKEGWSVTSIAATNTRGNYVKFEALPKDILQPVLKDPGKRTFYSEDKRGRLIIQNYLLHPFIKPIPPAEPSGYLLQTSLKDNALTLKLDPKNSMSSGINIILKDATGRPAGSNSSIEVAWFVDDQKIINSGYSFLGYDPYKTCLFDKESICTWSRLEVEPRSIGQTSVRAEARRISTGEILASYRFIIKIVN